MKQCFRGFACISLFLVLLANISFADEPEQQGYYRWATAYGDQVAFTADGDLWIAPLSGGEAKRLTSARGEERFAMFSPDGQWIAFSGNYDGNTDVYIIRPTGGEPRRLTWHPGADFVASWTPDGKIAFRSYSHNGQRSYEIFTVSTDGGYPEKLAVDEAAHIAFEPNGDRIAYTRYSLGYRTWKRYKGGWAEDIWVGSTKTHDYKEVTNNVGNDATPMWFNGRIYYVRDNDARANIHSMKPDGSDIRQHTFHTDWDVRWPSLADGKIAYTLGADIWIFDPLTNETHRIDVALPSERLEARDRFVSPEDYSDFYGLSPDGKRLLLSARGDLFLAPTERRGIIYNVSKSPSERERYPVYTPDGKQIVAWSDRDGGEEALYSYSSDGKGEIKRIAAASGPYNFKIAITPDGKFAAYGDNNRKLQLVNLETGDTEEIDESQWEIRTYEWSPDSRYLAYQVEGDNDFQSIRVYDTKDKTIHYIVDEMWNSFSPTWDPKGKWLYFFSARHPNAFAGFNDFSFITLDTEQLFALALQKDTKSPYAYTDDMAMNGKDEKKKDEEKEKKKKDDDEDEEKEEKVEPIIIDWEGIQDRIVQLPLDPGNYGQLGAIEGKLYYTQYQTSGFLDDYDEDDPRSSLCLFDIEKRKTDTVIKGASSFVLSQDRKKLAAYKKKNFIILDAGETKEPEVDENDPDAGLHLEEWVYDIDPRIEWRHIFHEAWKHQRDFFYDPDMHGIDWPAERDRYAPLVERIGTRDELNDIIAQLFGEMNVGHAYIYGGDRETPKSIGIGLLGIDVTRESNGFYRIDRVLRGDVWDEDRSSPLAAPGMNVKDGSYLVAIDRKPVNSVDNYFKLLNNKAGKLILVSVNDKPSLDGARELVIKTMSRENELRYWDWVQSRRDYIKEKAGEYADDIAYVHLSDMGGEGMEQWMREFYPQSKKKALIMDVRWNGGGNIARWILSQLERTVWTWTMARNGALGHSPGSAFYGHMIALCNAETGSDGETFSEGFKRLKLGPLVGMRTWGGWVGIRGGKPFLDRGGSTNPEFTGWSFDSTWLIEGPGVYPDVEIENMPKPQMQGIDEQLDYAIDYLIKKLKEEPVVDPPMPPFPDKSPTGYK
ncbi:PDZ domain-containing protein [bacterium]|nr:PDZ domain-containing protein [bacterium]